MTDPFFLQSVMGSPLWMWLVFAAVVVALLALDLGVLHRKNREIGVRESLLMSGFYIVLGLAFGGWVWLRMGPQAGVEYVTGYLVEKSLALDNVFVIATIFASLAIPRAYQHRVLFWGILGAILLRGVMIGAGAALVARFDWILLIFAGFLIFLGAKMFVDDGEAKDPRDGRIYRLLTRFLRVTPRVEGSHFFVRAPAAPGAKTVLWATPLFLAVVMVELADVIFAVDSVPAIFAITTDPYLVYTSNIFAILGLRALYFALAAVIARFAYLGKALALLLVFIGGKVLVAEFMGWQKFPAPVSLAVTALLIGGGVAWSMWKTRRLPPAAQAVPPPAGPASP